jgi:hypothetical protein
MLRRSGKLRPRRADHRSRWRVAQFDTSRPRLIKRAVRIEVLAPRARLHVPRAMPDQAIFTLLPVRMPGLWL